MWEEGVTKWYQSMVQPLDWMGRMHSSCIHVDCICIQYACGLCVCYVCMTLVIIAVLLSYRSWRRYCYDVFVLNSCWLYMHWLCTLMSICYCAFNVFSWCCSHGIMHGNWDDDWVDVYILLWLCLHMYCANFVDLANEISSPKLHWGLLVMSFLLV